jgi:hypothetical protein
MSTVPSGNSVALGWNLAKVMLPVAAKHPTLTPGMHLAA